MTGHGQVNRETQDGRVFRILLIFLVLISCSCGCIKVVQRSLSQSPAGNESATGNGTSGSAPAMYTTAGSQSQAVPAPGGPPRVIGNHVVVPSSTTTAPSGSMAGNAAKPPLVSDASPIPVLAGGEIQHATRVNISTAYNPGNMSMKRAPDFQKTYTLNGNAVGMVVNVETGPLIIEFDVHPAVDCMNNPGSCRGSLAASVNRPYFIITVRDNTTQKIVAQDGYGREFSSDTSDRVMTIYGQGQYHITLEGSWLDVTLGIATGSSPGTTGATTGTGTVQATMTLPGYLRPGQGV